MSRTEAVERFPTAVRRLAAMRRLLLKVGEEEELTEAVLARAASELRHNEDIDLEDLHAAFAEVRPPGRIFHENLFRHADEVVRAAATTDGGVDAGDSTGPFRNLEFQDFLTERLEQSRPRIRWRRFDRNGDGTLSADEIAELAEALVAHPDHVLVASHGERHPDEHPPYRDRVLLLQVASGCSDSVALRRLHDPVEGRSSPAMRR